MIAPKLRFSEFKDEWFKQKIGDFIINQVVSYAVSFGINMGCTVAKQFIHGDEQLFHRPRSGWENQSGKSVHSNGYVGHFCGNHG